MLSAPFYCTIKVEEGGVGEPRNNNVKPCPVGRAWIFLAAGGELFATKKFNSPI